MKSEKLYKKADAAYQLANRLYAAKRQRILASQERAPASKQQRYVDMLQQLSHDRLLSQILSLKYKVIMGDMLNKSTACDLKRKELEIRRLRGC